MNPLISRGLEDVKVFAVVQVKPIVTRVLTDAGAAVGIAAFVVVKRLRSTIVFGHDVTFDIAKWIAYSIKHYFAAKIPGATSSQAGHGAGSDKSLHLAKRVVSLAKDRELMRRVAVPMAVNGSDCTGGLAVANG